MAKRAKNQGKPHAVPTLHSIAIAHVRSNRLALMLHITLFTGSVLQLKPFWTEPTRVFTRCANVRACVRTRLSRHASRVTHHTSRITRHASHVTHHTSRITRHASHVTHHTSRITRHASHVTRTRCDKDEPLTLISAAVSRTRPGAHQNSCRNIQVLRPAEL